MEMVGIIICSPAARTPMLVRTEKTRARILIPCWRPLLGCCNLENTRHADKSQTPDIGPGRSPRGRPAALAASVNSFLWLKIIQRDFDLILDHENSVDLPRRRGTRSNHIGSLA